ncbi:MAG: hypothetical protein PVG76_05515 [Chromatiales bacterium]|jgi:hypothetical protein
MRLKQHYLPLLLVVEVGIMNAAGRKDIQGGEKLLCRNIAAIGRIQDKKRHEIGACFVTSFDGDRHKCG